MPKRGDALTPMNDENRIPSYKKKNTISSRQMVRVKKIRIKELSVDPIRNSQKYPHKNCMTDNKENY